MNKPYRILLVAVMVLVAAACSGGSDSPTIESTETGNTRATEVDSTPPDSTPAGMANGDHLDWYTAELTNVRTGETFTLADFQGKTVFVESMATWCTNCRRQLQNVRAARETIEGDGYVFVALSLETNLSDSELADYTTREGFDWTFAVMSADMLRAFVDQFGRSVSNAPSTPHFVIRPDGSFTDLVTGIDSPGELIDRLNTASGA